MCEITSWQMVLAALFAILEYWLGTTDLIKAGSTLELIWNAVKGLLKFLPLKK